MKISHQILQIKNNQAIQNLLLSTKDQIHIQIQIQFHNKSFVKYEAITKIMSITTILNRNINQEVLSKIILEMFQWGKKSGKKLRNS